MKILVINGPNINMLGVREPEIYGHLSLSDIERGLREYSKNFKNIEIEFFQSNCEGAIIDTIQRALNLCDGIIINPAAYTHTSVAIRDAISSVKIPAVEVHLSNINSREEFRKNSYIAPVCIGQVSGFGAESYQMALLGLYNHLMA